MPKTRSLTPTLRQTTYVFGRLNLVANYTNYDEKFDILFRVMRKEGGSELYDAYWSFADVERLILGDNNDVYIYGVLAKSATRTNETVDRGSKRLKTATVENLVIAKSPFFLNVRTGIIAFTTVSQIPTSIFQARFRSLIANREFMADAEIRMLEERNTVLDKFTTFDKIMRISIILHPSNPNSRDVWASVDERIKDLKANTIQEIIDGKKNSGGLDKDALAKDGGVKAKVSMTEDGYGSTKISGTGKDGKPKVIETGRKPLKDKGASAGTPESILKTLGDAFGRIIASMQ